MAKYKGGQVVLFLRCELFPAKISLNFVPHYSVNNNGFFLNLVTGHAQ